MTSIAPVPHGLLRTTETDVLRNAGDDMARAKNGRLPTRRYRAEPQVSAPAQSYEPLAGRDQSGFYEKLLPERFAALHVSPF